MEASNTPVESLSYEQAIQELARIVSVLENEEQTLEQAIGLYERGQGLAQHCNALLEKAELSVRTITDEPTA